MLSLHTQLGIKSGKAEKAFCYSTVNLQTCRWIHIEDSPTTTDAVVQASVP